jgi:FixJ family two-component response regulator
MMPHEHATQNQGEGAGVSLVDGDSDIRHARQIMLRSENYQVRSYTTCAAILADPQARNFPCIVVDADLQERDGLGLLREMRAKGWKGRAILLGAETDTALAREAARNGDQLLGREIGDRPLLAAIAASIGKD